MGSGASRRTDLIYPRSFMGWQSERLTFLPERIWIANILQSAGRRKEGVLTPGWLSSEMSPPTLYKYREREMQTSV